MDFSYTEEQDMVRDTVKNFIENEYPLDSLREFRENNKEEFDADMWKKMSELGWMGLAIPEAYGGSDLAFLDLMIVMEEMGRGLLHSPFYATVGECSLPLIKFGTDAQKEKYLEGISCESAIWSFAFMEEAGDYEPQEIQMSAKADGDGYVLDGRKIWVPYAHVANKMIVVARTSDNGVTAFIVDAKAAGIEAALTPSLAKDGKCIVTFSGVKVSKEDILGEPDKGWDIIDYLLRDAAILKCAEMSGGVQASLALSNQYAKERVQFGTTLSEKQGYTHKLIVPHAVQLEAVRAFIEETGRRLDTDEEDLQVEGSIAKWFATEAGDAMANDAIQAFGGYGYTREYEVEKIKRDVKILTIYEGTSEIQQSIIATFRLRSTVRSKGVFYQEMADSVEKLPEDCGGAILAGAIRVTSNMIFSARKNKLTKQQHVMFQLAEMITWCEISGALCQKAAVHNGDQGRSADYVKACARLFAREAIEKVYVNGIKIAQGCGADIEEAVADLNSLDIGKAMKDGLADMNLVLAELVA